MGSPIVRNDAQKSKLSPTQLKSLARARGIYLEAIHGAINGFTSVRLAAKGAPIGSVFGRLTTLGPCFMLPRETQPSNYQQWVVAGCECGSVRCYRVAALRRGHTTSCGCFMREVSGTINLVHGKCRHNEPRHPLHGVWCGMIRRCENTTDQAYPDYGGRGISICPEWREDFMAFYNWAMANGWEHGLEIDRYPNNDGNYEPTNCRIATRSMQLRNTRKNRKIEAFGEVKLLCEWLEDPRCIVNESTLRVRLKLGWEPERAIVTPRKALGIDLREPGGER
jgi:hypothetical protein